MIGLTADLDYLKTWGYFVERDSNIVRLCRGFGVIGEQPVLLPGTSFEYTSACPLRTATGRMVNPQHISFNFCALSARTWLIMTWLVPL